MYRATVVGAAVVVVVVELDDPEFATTDMMMMSTITPYTSHVDNVGWSTGGCDVRVQV